MIEFVITNLPFILTQLLSLAFFLINQYVQTQTIKRQIEEIEKSIEAHEKELNDYIEYKRELIAGINTIKTHAEEIHKLNISIEKLIVKMDLKYDK